MVSADASQVTFITKHTTSPLVPIVDVNEMLFLNAQENINHVKLGLSVNEFN